MSPQLCYIGCDLSIAKQQVTATVSRKDTVGRFSDMRFETVNKTRSCVFDLPKYNCSHLNIPRIINHMIEMRVKEGKIRESSSFAIFMKKNRQKLITRVLGQPVQVGSFPSRQK
jgi:hypothetical protein